MSDFTLYSYKIRTILHVIHISELFIFNIKTCSARELGSMETSVMLILSGKINNLKQKSGKKATLGFLKSYM